MAQILERIYQNQDIFIEATTGRETFAKARDLFWACLDLSFDKKIMDNPSIAKPRTSVKVYDALPDPLRKNTLGEVLDSFSPLSKVTLTQSQAVRFCRDHPDKLRQDIHDTFFLFEDNKRVLIAAIYRHNHMSGTSDGSQPFDVCIPRSNIDDYKWWIAYGHRLIIRS